MRSRPSPRPGFPWLVVVGVLVAALSLRGPIVAPTPVLRQIEADLGIGSASAGVITGAPVLMFALITPVAALVIRRAGAEIALLLSLGGVLVGTIIRALPGFGAMVTGMLVIGAAITIGNVVIPVIIRRDVPAMRVGLVTAAYAATLNVGSLITSLLTAPLASAVGWVWALLIWGGLTAVGVWAWSVHLRAAGREGPLRGERDSGELPTKTGHVDLDPVTMTGPLPTVTWTARRASVFRRPVLWLLLATFAAQTTIYYTLSTWLPAISADELGLDPTAAGAMASLFQGVAIAGAFVVPLLARAGGIGVPAVVVCLCWITLTSGMLIAPELLPVWLAVGAVAHSGGFVVIFTMLVQASRSDAEAATMSAVIQGGGYALGAFGAPVAGALNARSGGWEQPLMLLLLLACAYAALMAASVVAGRRGRRP